MIRDTFESNPGLCELFKRKMLERARFVGFSEGLIDFESQIDIRGTYQDNLRIFYREYPQLSQKSDYFRIKSIRPLSGVALEQSWRSYERNNGYEITEPTEQPLTAEAIMPELTITYTIGCGPVMARKEEPKDHEPISAKPIFPQADADSAAATHRELLKSILDRVTAMTGEKATRMILHQIGQEIGRTAFNHSKDQTQSMSLDNLVESLDRVLSIRGWGRVQDLDKIDHGSSVTYVCTINGCPLCYDRVSRGPTCDIMCGVVSRGLGSIVQKNAESIETTCVAAGSQPCVFRVTFRK
jgi:predicted hydrocarbon binding protein